MVATIGPFICGVMLLVNLNLVVDPPQVCELDVTPVPAVSGSPGLVVANELIGKLELPGYSTSIQISSLFGTAPPPQMPSTVTVIALPVISFQIEMGKHSNGFRLLALAVVMIFHAIVVVPSEAPPVRTMVVSVDSVPSYQYRS